MYIFGHFTSRIKVPPRCEPNRGGPARDLITVFKTTAVHGFLWIR